MSQNAQTQTINTQRTNKMTLTCRTNGAAATATAPRRPNAHFMAEFI